MEKIIQFFSFVCFDICNIRSLAHINPIANFDLLQGGGYPVRHNHQTAEFRVEWSMLFLSHWEQYI